MKRQHISQEDIFQNLPFIIKKPLCVSMYMLQMLMGLKDVMALNKGVHCFNILISILDKWLLHVRIIVIFNKKMELMSSEEKNEKPKFPVF